MPGDLTISFLLDADSRALDPEQDAFRWQIGDIVDCLRSADIATWDGSEWRYNRDALSNPRLAFLHIVGAPDRFYNDPEKLARGVRVPVPEAPDPGEYAEIRARRFRVVRANMPTPRLREINERGETTMGWLAVRSFDVLRRKDVTVRLNRLLDTERTILDTED